MSKSHPNSSQDFTIKQEKRKARTNERELLSLAKKIYYDKFGIHAILFRNKLNAIKAELKEQLLLAQIIDG